MWILNLAGYEIFWGDQDGVYNHPDSPISVGTVTRYDFPSGMLIPGTHYYFALTAKDISGNLSSLSDQVEGELPPDTTPPTVAITNPSQGDEVNGIVTINAEASDNIGGEGVRFLINDVPFGAEDIIAPYSVDWDTSALPPDSYALKAIARDAEGNETTSDTVTVSVAAPPIDNAFPTVSITAPASGAKYLALYLSMPRPLITSWSWESGSSSIMS